MGDEQELPFAKGGSVQHFCSTGNIHNEDCEYFVDGGGVGALPAFEDTQPAQNAAPADNALPAFEDTKAAEEAPLPHFDDTHPIDEDRYSGVAGAVEATGRGFARGLTGGLSDTPYAQNMRTDLLPKDVQAGAKAYYEKTNPNQEDIQALKEAHPTLSGAGELVGTGAAMAGMNAVLPGSSLIRAAITGGVIHGANEISDSLLGRSPPENAVAPYLATAGAAILNAATDGIFSIGKTGVSKGLQALGSETWAPAAKDFVRGISDSANGIFDNELGRASKAYGAGLDFLNKGVAKATRYGADYIANGIAAAHGYNGPISAYFSDKILGPAIEKIIGRPIGTATNKYIAPAVLRMLSVGDGEGIEQAVNYGIQIAKGEASVNKGIESLFSAGTQKAYDSVISDRERDDVTDFLKDGGIGKQMQNQHQSTPHATLQNFAEGGQVKPVSPDVSPHPDHFATAFPEQNLLLNTAKGRIATYLSGLRPSDHTPKLPFDRASSNKEQKKIYGRAVDLAIKPLNILNQIKNSTLTPEGVQHFTSLYPEMYSHLSKKMTEQIVKSQLKGEKPPYRVRQSMSLFLGAPLDSTLTQQNIQAAQGVFVAQAMQKQAQGQQVMKKRGTAALSKSSEPLLTGDQAREQRISQGKS